MTQQIRQHLREMIPGERRRIVGVPVQRDLSGRYYVAGRAANDLADAILWVEAFYVTESHNAG